MSTQRNAGQAIPASDFQSPPHAIEAEREVIGACLLAPDLYPFVCDRLTIDHWADSRHRHIWRALALCWEQHKTLDLLLVVNVVPTRHLDLIGGLPYLSALSDQITHATQASLEYYIRLIEETWRRRHIATSALDVVSAAHNFSDSSKALNLLVEAARIEQERYDGNTEPDIKQILQQTFDLIQACQSGKSGRVLFGVEAIDEKLTVMPPDLILLAGRPGTGKTALALQWMGHLLDNHRRVAMFSLEMERTQLMMRWLSSLSGVSTGAMRKVGGLCEHDLPKLYSAAQRILTGNWDLCLEDGGEKTIADIRAQSRAWHRKTPLSLIIVDYFQLLKGAAEYGSREQELADCSRQLKALAKELHVPVCALVQMNRKLEDRKNSKNPHPRPNMGDLRETGQLEQDADAILFTHSDDEGEYLFIEKQRMDEAKIDIPLRYNKRNQTFSGR